MADHDIPLEDITASITDAGTSLHHSTTTDSIQPIHPQGAKPNTRESDDSTSSDDIDVARAEDEFHKVEQEINADLRKADPEQQEEFDLQDFFEDSVRKSEKKGHQLKRMGVVVEDLSVVGLGADATRIPDNFSPLKTIGKLFWPPNWFRKEQKGSLFKILKDVSAFCKDGEMLLVLGRPGSGCSTFLRLAANQARDTYVDVTGKVSYGGLPAENFGPYMGEVIYAPEEDTHFPTLTLKQTLKFALRLKTPGHRVEQTRKDFRDRVFDALVTMFGIKKQANTMVGNEWVRGLSGGERKRLTIAEAMTSQAAINCWDCSTRGLDAASALDYAKSLRIMTNVMRKSTIASFYQASESIYDLFDRVLVLDKGRCIYFGPTKDAKQYFLDLGFDCEPRKSTPDFVTGITNPQERKFKPGCEDSAPKTAGEFEKAWLESENRKEALVELQQYKEEVTHEKPWKEFKKEVEYSKANGVRKKSAFTVSVWTQAYALLVRQFLIIWGDKFDIFSRYFSAIAQAIIYGSLFLGLELNAEGGFGRGSAIFVSILFNGFSSIAEMTATFNGRRILQKQHSYAMYHPAAFHIAQVLMDIPILLLQSIVFSSITYWMFGLQADAGKFFIYVLVLFLTGMAIAQLFRMLGLFSPSLFLSQQMLNVVFVLLLTYCGYFITYDRMVRPLFWIFWINPFAYAFKALYLNEMEGLVFDCSTSGHIPFGPTYTSAANRVCQLAGAVPGETTVTGETYILTAYGFEVSEKSLDIMAVALFWLLFTIANLYAIEKLDWVKGGYTRKVFKGGKAPKQNDEATELEQARIVEAANENMQNILEMKGGVFLWDKIKYTVTVPTGDLLLLNNISGWIRPGQMTALMGASGAGKTTLLDVLAQRKTMGVVEGTMLLNGKRLRKDFERITGYVEQMDVHNGFMTVREALLFSAKLRQEPEVPTKEKEEYVDRVLEMMEMSHLREAMIGDLESGVGISVEERKRLTIGLELVAKPHILFLDEPTSGLDAQSAYNIIKFIRKLADAGMPLVCTIHQPSSVLFEYFDRLLLLAKGGKTVYFGDIGERSRTMLDYFEENGARACTESENPAEYILEVIGAGVHGKAQKDWADVWASSPQRTTMTDDLTDLRSGKSGVKPTETSDDDVDLTVRPKNLTGDKIRDKNDSSREFATSWWYQFVQLYIRLNVVFWRNPSYNFSRLVQSVVVGLVIGFSFWQLGDSTSDMQFIILAVFQILILGILLIVAAMPQFYLLQALFRRDYASKFYSWFPFSLAMILVELPYLALAATLCVVCAYWSIGFGSYLTAYDGFYFWLFFVLFMWYCVSFGQLMAAALPGMVVAMTILPLFLTMLFLFAGVLAPPSQLPAFWAAWMYPLDPFRYFLEGVITDVMHRKVIVCSAADFFRFVPPVGQTCGQYMTDFFAAGNFGYINNPSATDVCEYCTFSSGVEFTTTLEWDVANRWRNFGILAGYWVFNIIVSSFFIWLFRKGKR